MAMAGWFCVYVCHRSRGLCSTQSAYQVQVCMRAYVVIHIHSLVVSMRVHTYDITRLQ
jgi:hypothetical protein